MKSLRKGWNLRSLASLFKEVTIRSLASLFKEVTVFKVLVFAKTDRAVSLGGSYSSSYSAHTNRATLCH